MTRVLRYGASRVVEAKDPFVDCALGEHGDCTGWIADNATHDRSARIVVCGCGCHIEPWPWPCYEEPRTLEQRLAWTEALCG